MADNVDIGSVIQDIFWETMASVNTVSIGQIVTYDGVERTATIQPVFKRLHRDETTQEPLDKLYEVPVIFPGAGNRWLMFDLAVDSYVILLSCQRALDDFLLTGGVVNVSSRRRFHASDTIALAGICPQPLNFAAGKATPADTIELRNNDRSEFISFGPNGLNITASLVNIVGDITVDGKIESTGDVVVGGDVKATGEVIGSDCSAGVLGVALPISVLSHIHTAPPAVFAYPWVITVP